jgi:hypothetical protein
MLSPSSDNILWPRGAGKMSAKISMTVTKESASPYWVEGQRWGLGWFVAALIEHQRARRAAAITLRLLL